MSNLFPGLALEYGIKYPVHLSSLITENKLVSLQYKFKPISIDDSLPGGILETNENCSVVDVRLPCSSSSPRPFEQFRGGILSSSTLSSSSDPSNYRASLPGVLIARPGTDISFEIALCSAAVTNLRHVRVDEDIPKEIRQQKMLVDSVKRGKRKLVDTGNNSQVKRRAVENKAVEPKQKKVASIKRVKELYARWAMETKQGKL